MRSRIPVAWVMILAVLLFSVVPAAAVSVQPVQASSTCNWAQFVADVNNPDGTNVAPGLTFTKTWRLKNIGTCTWTTSYKLVFSSGAQLGGPSSVNLPVAVAPGQTVDLSVNLTAPTAAGHYIGYWQFKNASGVIFGIGSTAKKAWWIDINVLPVTTFGVAYDFAANYCSASWYSLQGSLPCPGTDGDSRGFVLKVDDPQLENGTVATGSGLILVPQAAFDGDLHGAFPAFHVQAGDHFRSIVDCAFGATSCFVTVRLDYQIGDGPINTFWSLREKSDGLVYRTDLDLSSLAGQDVKFILTLLATGSADGDRALWANPVIARPGVTPPPVTPVPVTLTPAPAGCDRAQFVADVNVPDGTTFAPGSAFTKTWRLKNVGTCTWTTFYSLVFDTGDKLGGPDFVNLPHTVAPGQTVDVSVGLTAPGSAASYRGLWKFQNAAGVRFGVGASAANSWWVAIRVAGTPVTLTPGTPTFTPTATPTGTPAVTQPPASCDRAQFIADVNVPDGTIIAPGAVFTKTWRLKNVGTCTWTTSYAMVFASGAKMGAPDSVSMPKLVPPGQTVDISVNLTAPVATGLVRGYWMFQNASGVRFGLGTAGTKSWWVEIRVSGTPASRTPTPTPTTTPGTSTPIPGLILRGYVRLPDGSGLPGIPICRSYAGYSGVIVATTDTSGYFQSDFAFIPGDEMVTVWPGAAGYTYQPPNAYWRHYYGPEDRTFTFVASPSADTQPATPPTPCPPVTAIPPSPTPTASGTDTTGWNTYVDGKYSFSFKFPPGSSIVSQSDNAGYVDLPFTAGTTLREKRIDVTVVEGANPCKSPNAGQVTSSENVTINGIQFLKELGVNGTAGHFYDLTAYSTLQNNACISLTFQLRSVDPGVFTTPPPDYDKAAESAVFPVIMSTFALSSPPVTATVTPPVSTSTPTPSPTATLATGWNTYLNGKYSFSFQFPPGSTVSGQTDSGGRLTLPFTHGTNLLEKHLDVNISEGVNPCKNPESNPNIPPENVTFNGIPFLKETWENGATSHRGDFTSYSTAKGNACISLTFWLWSVVPEVMETPPPPFDPAVETAIFNTIMLTYANQ